MNAKVPVLPLVFALVTVACLGVGLATKLGARSLGAPAWVSYAGSVLTTAGIFLASIPLVVIVAIRVSDRKSKHRRRGNRDGGDKP